MAHKYGFLRTSNTRLTFLALTIFILFIPRTVSADNWPQIVTSGDYYYGEGHGATEKEASENALQALIEMISVNVKSKYSEVMEEVGKKNETELEKRVQNSLKTVSQQSLINVKKMVDGKAPNIAVLRYIHKNDLETIYQDRIAKAFDFIRIANENVDALRIGEALEYYYWAYNLIRSVQRPNEVKDKSGRLFVNWLPRAIEQLLSDIKVTCDDKDGDRVNLSFTYNKKPIADLEFNYYDGKQRCTGTVNSGRSMIQMAEGHTVDTINIEYEYLQQAMSDFEMEGVMSMFKRKEFRGKDRKKIDVKKAKPAPTPVPVLKPLETQTQLVSNSARHTEVVGKVLEAIQNRRYLDASSVFTSEGLSWYNKLIGYGKAHIIGNPEIQFIRSANGNTVARGLQMSFSFQNVASGTKKTFVEDVVFTIDSVGKICNVSFGLGKTAEDDILAKKAGWTDATREAVIEFMENYKTAYSLKRIDYIRDIFADDAVIIVGNVVKKQNKTLRDEPYSHELSADGKQIIHYNRYTKDEYLKNLERCFQKNEFINLRFTNNEVQWLEKFDKEKLFAIQIGQEYYSSTYADKGYLFLLVDMTNPDAPQIKIRTWQPNEVAMDKLYNAGRFFK